MQEGTYFSYWITNISGGNQFSCFTQSGDKKEYDGTLSAKQRYVVITDESTTNGVHKYRIGNNTNFNGDNGDYSKWKALPTYTLPNNAVKGNTYEHIEYGDYLPLTDYHGQTVDGQIYCKWHWDIPNKYNVRFVLSYIYNQGFGFVFTLRHEILKDVSFTFNGVATLYVNNQLITNQCNINITTFDGSGNYSYRVTSKYGEATARLQYTKSSISPQSGKYGNSTYTAEVPRSFSLSH